MNLIVSAISNHIFFSQQLSDGTMATNRKDMTKEAVEAVATHIYKMQQQGDGRGYKIPMEDGEFFLTLVPAEPTMLTKDETTDDEK